MFYGGIFGTVILISYLQEMLMYEIQLILYFYEFAY